MKNFTEIFIRRPVLATVMSIIILMVGLVSWRDLNVRQFPEVDKPLISVTTSMEGASPQIIESTVTQPLEKILGGLEGLDYMTSRSDPENSIIKLNFKIDRDLDAAASDVRDRLARAKDQLPEEAADPLIKKADADASPIIFLALYSPRKTVAELGDYAHRFLESDVETIKGVASVDIWGGGELEMHLVLDPVRLNAYKITATDVASALKRNNVKKPAGRIESDEREFMVTISNKLNSVKQFNEMVISERDGAVVRLKDVGFAEVNSDDKKFASRFNDYNAVSIGLIKQSIANPLTVKEGLEEKLKTVRNRLPKDVYIDISYDKTVFIQRSIDQVYQTIFEAIILVTLVVFFFLRSMRASIIPLVTIPVSLIGAFALMSVFGFSINILTLLAMVLAIGLVVDDAIVVLENIYKHIEHGDSPFRAAINGTREISFAVIAMTLTLAAVYAPVALSSGMTGRLFTEFALTLAGAVIISGFVALTLSPVMCSLLLKGHEKPKSDASTIAKWQDKFSTTVGGWLDWLDTFYGKLLKKTLAHRTWTLGVCGGLTAVSILAAIYGLPRELTPSEDQGVIYVSAQAPNNANLKAIDRYFIQADKVIGQFPELVKRMSISQVQEPSYSYNTMLPWEERTRSCPDVKNELQPLLDKITGLTFNSTCLSRSIIGGSKYDLEYVLETTKSNEELVKWASQIYQLLEQHPGVRVDNWDVYKPNRDYIVEIEADRAAILGIDADTIAQTLDTLIGGRRSTFFERENKKYPVRVWVGEQFRKSPDDILSMYVRGAKDGKETLVPLSDVIKINQVETQPSINHFDGLRAVTFYAFINEGYGLGQVLDQLNEVSKQILPDGFLTTVSGQTSDYLQESNTLILIFGLAFAFIFLVMAAQFESFVDPFIIILTVPLSLAGAVITLWLVPTGSLNIYSQIGLVTLIGLITKHGILIVEFANQLRDQGRSLNEAIVEASRLRLRPILMTTFAMVLGAVPLALATGAGAETRQQIGWVIVGGMTVGTLFTLFLVPAVYTYLSRARKSKREVEAMG